MDELTLNEDTTASAYVQGSSSLEEFLASAGSLNLAARMKIVEQALILFEQNFVHLPMKKAMYAVDPVQRLRLLLYRLRMTVPASVSPEFEFHREMLDVFRSVRDLHTSYALPDPFRGKVAVLGFAVEEFFEADSPKYLVAHLASGFGHPHFCRGVEVVSWSGVPISRAIEVSAEQHAGGNPASRHVKGLDGLTVRSLRLNVPPDARWVIVGYRDLEGTSREIRVPWRVIDTLSEADAPSAGNSAADRTSLGLDVEAIETSQARLAMFSPQVASSEEVGGDVFETERGFSLQRVHTALPKVLQAYILNDSGQSFLYLRIHTFMVRPLAFLNELVRLLNGRTDCAGLVIDLRGNGGGNILAAEALLQFLTFRRITPARFQFINSEATRRLCEVNETGQIKLGPWLESVTQSVETGAVYSQAHPITSPDLANRLGQVFQGPVSLIVDARCYSATDIFTAGFIDHDIGQVIGVDDNMGAGGANVWDHELIRKAMSGAQNSPYVKLPKRTEMRVSIRRSLRVNEMAGVPLEDLGIEPDYRYYYTRRDLLERNQDLIAFALNRLKDMAVKRLHWTRSDAGSFSAYTFETEGIDRIDVYVGDVPMTSIAIVDGGITLEVAKNLAGKLRFEGFMGRDQVVATRG